MKFKARTVFWGALFGAVIGLCLALTCVVLLWSVEPGGYYTPPIRLFLTAFVFLLVPFGAICGAALAALPAALAALFNCMLWCIEQVSTTNEKVTQLLDPKERRVIGLVCLASLIGIVITFILAYL